MVNRLFRAREHPEVAKVKIRYTGVAREVVGPVVLEQGTEAWVNWDFGRMLIQRGDAQALGFNEAALADPEAGFKCSECGNRYSRERELRGHGAAHVAPEILHDMGWTKGRPRKGKPAREYNRKVKKRKYNTEYQRKRRARLRAEKKGAE
jgi:hypothetical protein